MKSILNLAFAAVCLLLSSCLAVTYVGDKQDQPSTNVDVFYSAHDLKKTYKILGYMVWPNDNAQVAKQKMMEYGRSIGADAIIITGTQTKKDAAVAAINADAVVYEK